MQNNYISKTHVNKIATDLKQTSNRPPVLDHCCAICGLFIPCDQGLAGRPSGGKHGFRIK